MNWTTRPATPVDAPDCARILQTWLDATPWMPDLHDLAETTEFMVGRIDAHGVRVIETGAVAGFVDREGGEILSLYLSDDARGMGLGSALVAEAQARNPSGLSLWTFQANEGARRFYARHGFVEVARTDGSANDERLPDIHLIWPGLGGTAQ